MTSVPLLRIMVSLLREVPHRGLWKRVKFDMEDEGVDMLMRPVGARR